MSQDTLQGETLQGTELGAQAQALLVPTVTLAAHPDPSRVGQQYRLAAIALGQSVAIGRLEPEFMDARGRRGRPLEDPYISRRPIRFHGTPSGGVVVDGSDSSTELLIDGAKLDTPCEVDSVRLEQGVVLQLGKRVVLVLHLDNGTPSGASSRNGLVGISRAMVRLWAQIERVGQAPISVLLRGESGTGKELVARAIHDNSRRASAPFISVNMAAVPATTAASELFGHTRGAYTEANDPRPGFFGQADLGTLFLDEIGETPDEVQPLLLRALESGEIQPLGARRAGRVDVRLIAATDTDLELAIREGNFRLALLNRLATYTLVLPPLRRRREDIGLLFVHFLQEELQRSGRLELLSARPIREAPWIPGALMAWLCRYEWPGNVRQLRNVVRRLVVDGCDRPHLEIPTDLRHLMERMTGSATDETVQTAPTVIAQSKRREPRDLSTITDQELISALETQRWKIAATARELGVSKNSLYKLMERSTAIRKAKDLQLHELTEGLSTYDGDLTALAMALRVSRRGLQLRMRELKLELS